MANNIDGVKIIELVEQTTVDDNDFLIVETKDGTRRVSVKSLQDKIINISQSDIDDIYKELYP